jgi:tetratricopeptide (TPR) repeat protein
VIALVLLFGLAQDPAAAQDSAAAQEPDPSELFAAGRDEAALAACDRRLAARPADAAALELRARCLRSVGRYDEAAEALRRLPRRTMALDLLLAECLAARREGGAEADAILQRWATADSDDAALRLARSRVHLLQRRVPQALADARFVVARDPGSFEAQLLLARATDAAGRFEEARRRVEPLVERAQDGAGVDVHLRREAAAALAVVLIRQQRYDDGVALLRGLVEECPTMGAWRALLATILGIRHRYAEAIEHWEKLVELAPTDAELRWRLGDIYRSQGRLDEAIAQFRAMLELGQARAVAELKLGELYLERGAEGDLERARAHVQEAEALSPDSGDVAEAKARVLEKLGNFAAAKELHRKAFARNPLRFEALYRLALLLARSRDEEELAEAEALFERYRRIEPLLVEIRLAKQELDANPAQPALHTRMAGMLNLAGEYEPAKAWTERAEKLDPRSVQNAVQMGYILANLDDLPGARRSFEKAIALLGSAPEAAEAVAKLRGYVEKIARGEPLPRPLGEMARPAQAGESGNLPPAPTPPAGDR